jgi:parvulin-like peptidyl-prolyl isomerase
MKATTGRQPASTVQHERYPTVNLKPTLNNIGLALTALSIGLSACAEALAADASAEQKAAPPVFAQVGNATITQREFDSAYAAASRNRFYHGKPPDAEVAALQREIGEMLITNVLLLTEAKRLKLKPDAAEVKKRLEKVEQRNSGNAQWQNIRDRALPVLTKQIEDQNLISQLEQRVRKVPAPNEKQLRAYYDAHPEKFTEPQQIRISIILLGVDPGAPDFDAKRKLGEELVKQLREGADFAEMATRYSTDAETVGQGGDMGYLHGGMLSELSEQVAGKLKPGEISDPVTLMEGIGIYKLTERMEAKLNSFDEVKERATALYLKDEGERAWKSLIAKLKKKTPIKVDESRYLPLPKPAETDARKPAAQTETKTAEKTPAAK